MCCFLSCLRSLRLAAKCNIYIKVSVWQQLEREYHNNCNKFDTIVNPNGKIFFGVVKIELLVTLIKNRIMAITLNIFLVIKSVYLWANVIANILSTVINIVNRHKKLYGKKIEKWDCMCCSTFGISVIMLLHSPHCCNE